jgi:phosphate transport system substrate-binding protein
MLVSFATVAEARDQIRAVGSSTVYPFTTAVAEEFGKTTSFKTPVVESTGTGGGFKLFCAGIDEASPDISNASRAIKSSEVELCKTNGVKDIAEIKIGYDGIVLANSTKAPHYKLTKKQIFLGLARQVPVDGKLVSNPYKKWNEIDPALPNEGIEVYGPPPTSGTRDAFAELVMQEACKEFPEFVAAYKDEDAFKNACSLIREDGKFVEAGENDNLIVQKLVSNPHALGIFGYSFLEQNGETIQGSHIDGVQPTYENIAAGSYKISRPLYVYVKKAHVGIIPGIKEFIAELTSDKAMGEEGYLSMKGLIPLPKAEFDAVKANVAKDFPQEKTDAAKAAKN